MMVLNRKKVITLALASLLVIAGYLNWNYKNETGSLETAGELGKVELVDGTENSGNELEITDEISTANDDTKESPNNSIDVPTVIPVEPPASSTSTEVSSGFFNDATINRQKAASEAVEMYEGIIQDKNASAETKKDAEKKIMDIAKNIERQSVIENLIKAKGFKDVLVSISDDRINVMVKSDTELTKVQTAQIQDAVMGTVSTSSDKISIVPIK